MDVVNGRKKELTQEVKSSHVDRSKKKIRNIQLDEEKNNFMNQNELPKRRLKT